MPSILMISPNHFTPWGGPRGARSRRIAAALAERGWRVRLAVSGEVPGPPPPGVEIAVAPPGPSTDPRGGAVPARGGIGSLARSLLRAALPYPDAYSSWSLRARRALRDAEPADLVYVLAWPFSGIPAGAALARRYAAPLVVDLGDPWEHRGPAERLLERRALRDVAALVVTTPGTAALYRERTGLGEEAIAVVPNGAETTRAAPEERPQARGARERSARGHEMAGGNAPPLFLSLGTLSAPRIDPVPGFRALIELEKEGSLEFGFYGRVWLGLPEDVREHHRGVVPGEEARALTRGADAIVIVGNRDPQRVPSKVFEMARSDIPVLYLRGPEEDPGAELLAGTGHATIARGDDPAACRRAAEALLGRIASGDRPEPSERFSWEEATDRVCALVDLVLAEARRA